MNFDAAILKQTVGYDKNSESYVGLITEAEAVDRGEVISQTAHYVTIVAIRSIPFSKFRMPVGIFFQQGTGKIPEIRSQVRSYLDVSSHFILGKKEKIHSHFICTLHSYTMIIIIIIMAF